LLLSGWLVRSLFAIVVIVQVKLFVECPIHKLNEQDLTLAVFIRFPPLPIHVAGVNAPAFQHRFSLQKLLLVNTLVLAVIDFVERNEKLVVLA
jgi:hypothetical protein